MINHILNFYPIPSIALLDIILVATEETSAITDLPLHLGKLLKKTILFFRKHYRYMLNKSREIHFSVIFKKSNLDSLKAINH